MKILMFFHGGSLNRGCEAIVRSAAALIKLHHPSSELVLASRNPSTDKQIPGIDNIILDSRNQIKKYSLHWLIGLLEVKFLKRESYLQRYLHRPLINQINNYDIFLSIGGDNYCYGEQPGIYEIDRCIKKAGKRLILWGASIGKEDLSPAKLKDLAGFNYILARESLTFEVLTNAGLNNVMHVADGAFLMAKENLPLPAGWQDGNMVGFNFSPLVNKKNPAAKHSVEKLLSHILEHTSFAIALTPHVVEPNNNDFDLLAEFYARYQNTGRVIILPPSLSATELKGYIARMRFFIGARTHATIAAYSSEVPTLVLGYSIKSKGIAKDLFGDSRGVLAIEQLANEAVLIESFEELVKAEQEVKAILQQQLPHIKARAEHAINYIT